MLHAADRRRRGAHGRGYPPPVARRRRQGVDQHRRRGPARIRPRGGAEIRQPVHRRRDRRQSVGGPGAMGGLHPWRTAADRHRRGRLGPPARRLRRRRDSADLDGPRRHQIGVRHRLDPRRRRRGSGAGHRLGRGRHARPPGRGDSRRARDRGARRLDLSFRDLADRRGQGPARRLRHPGRGVEPCQKICGAHPRPPLAGDPRRGAAPIRKAPIPPGCSPAAAPRSPKSSARRRSRRSSRGSGATRQSSSARAPICSITCWCCGPMSAFRPPTSPPN